MRKIFVTIFIVALCGLFCQFAPQVLAQPSYPPDFEIEAVSGGFPPWTPLYRLEIKPNASVTYSRMEPEDRENGTWTKIGNFTLTVEQMNDVYESIQTNDFFTLTNESAPVYDGTFAVMTITANAVTHTVETENIEVEQFDNITKTINSVTPGDFDLYYNEIIEEVALPPTSAGLGLTDEVSSDQFFLPIDMLLVCLLVAGGLITAFKLNKEYTLKKIKRLRSKPFLLTLLLAMSLVGPVYAKTTVTRVECDIEVKLYIEFWSMDKPKPIKGHIALINGWKAGIEAMWNQGGKWRLRCPAPPCVAGLDGKGCPITFKVEVETRNETTAPKNGYHQIRIKHTDTHHVSWVKATPAPNSGTSTEGEWDDQDTPKVAAHEAGHLMGLDDQYKEVSKKPRKTQANPGHKNDIMANTRRCTEVPFPDAIAELVCTKGKVDCPKKPCCPDNDTEGGIVIPADKFSLLAPYVGATATILIAAVATAVYIKRFKSKNEK